MADRAGSTLALLAVVVLAAGCGGDGGEVSKAEYVRKAKANAVCGESNERVRALGPEPPILTAVQAEWLESLTESDQAAVAELRDMTPPIARESPPCSRTSSAGSARDGRSRMHPVRAMISASGRR